MAKRSVVDAQGHGPGWTLRRRVLPQHTDHAGVMWHGTYLSWLEEARVEALAMAGMAYSDLSDLGLELPVVSLSIDYRRGLRHGEAVELRSWVLPRSGVRLPWLSRFIASDGVLAAEARVDLVLVEWNSASGARRPLRHLPPDLEAAMARLERGQPDMI